MLEEVERRLYGFEHLVCLGEVVGLVIDAELVEAAYRSVAGGGFSNSRLCTRSELEMNAPLASLLDRPLCLDLLVSSGFSPRAGSTQRDQPRLDEVVLAVFEFQLADDAGRLERRGRLNSDSQG